MPDPDRATQFATRLHAMKTRSNRSYETLARKVGASSSALHRYCSGVTVPSSYDIIARFVSVCGATDEEAAELWHSWALATSPAGRTDPVAAQPDGPARPFDPTTVPHRPRLFVLFGLVLAVVVYLTRRRAGHG